MALESPEIDVQLKIQNNLQPEFFKHEVTVRYTPNSPLIRYLEQAAEQDSHFKFSATYFAKLGYFIDSINGLAGNWDNDKTYWRILNSDLEPLNLGVSNYIPKKGEHLMFKFTKSSQPCD